MLTLEKGDENLVTETQLKQRHIIAMSEATSFIQL